MVEIGVLGPVAIRRDGKLAHVGGSRQRALLIRLLLARGHSVPTGVLIDDVWCTPAAGDALKTSVSRLRQVLGAEAIGHDGTGYALTVGSDRIDASCFEAGVASARAHRAGDAATAARRYGRALDLWRGRALSDVEGVAWAQPEAARLEELRLVATEERFEALLAAGAASDIVADLASTAHEYPWREQLTAHLMVALYRCGRQREALEAFERLATALREELGLEPSPAVRELERSILRQDVALDAPTPFDRNVSGIVAGAPAPKSFVGRVGELAELEAAVLRSRVVSIVGPGGTGKTRLAEQLAQRVGGRFRAGACFVALGAARAPALVADLIASRLGLVDSAETGPTEPSALLAGYLHDRELLLVLDGCEPVPDIVASLVRRLRAECPHLHVVTTSREALGIGEEILDLGPMATPRPGADTEELTSSDAVRLYLARGEQLTVAAAPADLAAIGELTRLVGGNPLAIELVAGLTAAAPPAVILERARELLGVGRAGHTTIDLTADRAPSLRTTFALSHERLSDNERLLFRRAGVFAAGFGIEGLQAVAAGDGLDEAGVADALRALEASSLVYPMGYARDRRRMLDTVRDESLDRLRAAGEIDATLARQTAYYVSLAPRCDHALRGHGQDEARAMLDIELDNLRDVLDRLLASGDGETAAAITAALGDYWYLRGHWAESRRWVDRCVAATRGSRSLARAQVLRAHANRAGFSGIADRMAELDEALSIAREHDSREDMVWTLLFMASAAMSGGGTMQLHALVAEADHLIDALDDPWIRAVRRSYVAATDVTLDPRAAHQEQLLAHREFLALGDRAWAGRCLWFSGSIARRHLDLTTAEVELTRSIELGEGAGDRAATAHARASLARARLRAWCARGAHAVRTQCRGARRDRRLTLRREPPQRARRALSASAVGSRPTSQRRPARQAARARHSPACRPRRRRPIGPWWCRSAATLHPAGRGRHRAARSRAGHRTRSGTRSCRSPHR